MATILIIDDEESIRYTFESFLTEEGHEVHTARDLDEAVALLSRRDFDIVFSDIVLDGRTGIDVLREVKERGLYCPVVMITGYPSVATASEAVRLGAFDYIPKPVVQEALLRITRTALENKRLADERNRCRWNLESILRSVRDGILTVNKNLVVTEINGAAEEILGLSQAAVGKTFASLGFPLKERCLEAFGRAVETNEPSELHRLECQAAAGRPRVLSLYTAPLLGVRGVSAGAVMVVRDETRLADLERNLEGRRQLHNIVGKSEAMQRVYALIEALADVQTTVLITGESGTGKEVVAEALHHCGARSRGPLVKVNCAALSETLLESELFGHVKGAFTGAVRDKIGRFQRADGGTLFLDEIGNISPRMQSSLLRVLQEQVFERVGDSTPIQVDVRIIAATNQDLREKLRRGEFREDLYYRLKVVEIVMPPLRDRREDIPLLAAHFLEEFNRKFQKRISALSEEVQRALLRHPWPGNVRELQHALEHAFILSRLDTLTMEDLPAEFRGLEERGASASNPRESGPRNGRESILQALIKTGGNKAKASRLLGISERTMYRKINEHDITEEQIIAGS